MATKLVAEVEVGRASVQTTERDQRRDTRRFRRQLLTSFAKIDPVWGSDSGDCQR